MPIGGHIADHLSFLNVVNLVPRINRKPIHTIVNKTYPSQHGCASITVCPNYHCINLTL